MPVALLALGLLAPPGASASPATSRAACDGVRLLSQPYIAIGTANLRVGPIPDLGVDGIGDLDLGGIIDLDLDGIADITFDASGPVNDRVQCERVDRRLSRASARPGPAGGCENADVPGHRLRPRQAAAAVRCLINQRRRAGGIGQLDPHGALKTAAKRHTIQMLSAGCFSHACAGEADLVRRVTAAGYLPCVCAWSVGENIAWGPGKQGSPAGIVAAWMASPPHRELILTGRMKDVDVGVRRGKPGNRRAGAAIYTADFGYRR